MMCSTILKNLISFSPDKDIFDYFIRNENLRRVQQIYDLGVKLSKSFSFDEQISKICKEAMKFCFCNFTFPKF